MPPKKRFRKGAETTQIDLFEGHFPSISNDRELFEKHVKERHSLAPTVTEQLNLEQRLRLARAH